MALIDLSQRLLVLMVDDLQSMKNQAILLLNRIGSIELDKGSNRSEAFCFIV